MLAEQSARATTRIADLISEIQKGIGHTVSSMHEESEMTVQALKHVNEGTQILAQILEAVEEDGDPSPRHYYRAFSTQLRCQEIASATEEQAGAMQQVANMAQDLTALGVKLQDMVSRFKLAN